jgi:hypothetical protein
MMANGEKTTYNVEVLDSSTAGARPTEFHWATITDNVGNLVAAAAGNTTFAAMIAAAEQADNRARSQFLTATEHQSIFMRQQAADAAGAIERIHEQLARLNGTLVQEKHFVARHGSAAQWEAVNELWEGVGHVLRALGESYRQTLDMAARAADEALASLRKG